MLQCNLCDGELYPIGTLGNLIHLSCRQCGMQSSMDSYRYHELMMDMYDDDFGDREDWADYENDRIDEAYDSWKDDE